MKEEVSLHIYDYKCTDCGFSWTHSEPIVRTQDGGYIDIGCPREFDKYIRRSAQVTCYQRRQLLAPICHRCLPLGLHEGWTSPQPKDPSHDQRKPTPLSDAALDELLRS